MEYLVIIGEDEFIVDRRRNWSARWEGARLFKEKYNLPNPLKDIEPQITCAIEMPTKKPTESILRLLRAMWADRQGEEVPV